MLSMSIEAVVIKEGKRISYPDGSFLDDDLLVLAASCRLAGTIDGDVLAFGKEVRNTGTISGIFIAAGQSVTHSGEIKHSLAVCGEVIFLDGIVGGTSYAFGATVEIGTEANLKRALYATCGYFVLDGEIGGDANINCETAVISGVVGGDLELKAEEVEIRETATINGDLIVYCEEENLFIDDDALIGGEVVRRDPERGQSGLFDEFYFLSRLYFLAALLIIGLMVIVLSHKHVRRAASAIGSEPLRSLAFGILTFAGGLTLVVALSITVVGIPAASLVFISLGSMFIFVGQVYLATALAGFVRREVDSLGGTIVNFLLGLVGLGALLFVPYAGILAYLLAGLIGAGGFIAGLKERKATFTPTAFPAAPLSPPPSTA